MHEWESKFQSLKGMNRDFYSCGELVDPPLLPLYALHYTCQYIWSSSKSDLWPECATTIYEWMTMCVCMCVWCKCIYGKAITSMNNSLIIITVITIVIMDDCGQTWTIQYTMCTILCAHDTRTQILFHLWNWLTNAKKSYGIHFKWLKELDFVRLV